MSFRSAKPELAAWARSTNSTTAAESAPSPTLREGTTHACSAPTRNPSSDVAITFTADARPRTASMNSAAASNKCSQLSIISSSRRPDKACATAAVTDIRA